MSFGTFTIIKNEQAWIGPWLMAWLPFIDECVFFDGNSTDGTDFIIRKVKERHPLGHKITLWNNADPVDLQDDYVRRQDQAMRLLKTDFASFMHPDMFPISGAENLKNLGKHDAYFYGVRSYAGEPDEPVMYEIPEGRGKKWKNIMRLHNPDLGLHYHGHYGAGNEDMYFRDITGDSYEFHGESMEHYPYEVGDSGLVVAHFSDVRKYGRRLGRMISCLINQGFSKAHAEKIAPDHPRVTFDSRDGFVFSQTPVPECLVRARQAYADFEASIINERDEWANNIYQGAKVYK